MNAERSETLRKAVREKYRSVSGRPGGHFPYPVGRESALRLRYDRAWLAAVPAPVVDRFVGVGNPFSIRKPAPGERVLDVGCGCGLDAFVSSLLVGPRGRVAGLDSTPEMLRWPRKALARCKTHNLEFVEGSIEDPPFERRSFDLIFSNGVLNLVPDKDRAFRRLYGLLRPGGIFAAADLVVVEDVPPEVLADPDAWST
ncbi:MAG: methyltransferase domain-containing protein [Planctomycetes bacterium]|nr:methyltransferase domain-containing protein [Planctomycetota bacterium]